MLLMIHVFRKHAEQMQHKSYLYMFLFSVFSISNIERVHEIASIVD